MIRMCAVTFGMTLAISAHAVSFDLIFYNDLGVEVGTGFYQFDSIPKDTNTAFDDLTGVDWGFNLSDYNIAISSASGDSSSRESTADEGVFTTIIGSALNLRFFDSVGIYISHNDESAGSLRTSVRFLENSNEVEYIKDDVTLNTGTFSAVAVPEPASASLVIGLIALTAGFSARPARKAGVRREWC